MEQTGAEKTHQDLEGGMASDYKIYLRTGVVCCMRRVVPHNI